VKTDSEGCYQFKTTMPIPYQIPFEGLAGQLLDKMGSHTRRPAHVHIKAQKEGFHTLTMQGS